MFYRWGRFVYRFRWATLIASALMLGLSILAVFTGGTLADSGAFGATLPAGKASKLINAELDAQKPVATGSSFTLIFSSSKLKAGGPAFQKRSEEEPAELPAP